MDYTTLCRDALDRQLFVVGGFHPDTDDATLGGYETLLLLGPKEPEFWPALQQEPEWLDGHPDPIDRWSTRAIETWAAAIGATAFVPFGDAPYHPFFTWATRTARVHASPIMLLVNDQSGLFTSFRGALALPFRLELPEPPPSPCLTCADKPCLTACPVGAFANGAYDVPACRAHIKSPAGKSCLTEGCLARRACPVSAAWGRLPEQSGYHMKQFLGG